VTLYVVATLVSYPLAAAITGTSTPLLRLGLLAAAWTKYVLFRLNSEQALTVL
jgi:hypothetical protein